MPTEQEIVETPQRPGYYWAKWKIPSPGTFEAEEQTPSNFWEIVTVWENSTDPNSDERFGVSIPGVREAQWPDQFYWGPMVAEYNPYSVDDYVAWCRYTRRGEIVTCDSDDPKAFRVYRHPSAIPSLPVPSDPSREDGGLLGLLQSLLQEPGSPPPIPTEAMAEFIIRDAASRLEHFENFKATVHSLLDEMGVRKYEGETCRIRRRLASLRTALRELAEVAKRMSEGIEMVLACALLPRDVSGEHMVSKARSAKSDCTDWLSRHAALLEGGE